MKRSSLDQFRESLRLQQVYNVMQRYAMDMLFDRGIFTTPVVAPAVPPGRALIRVSNMATHTTRQLDYVINVFGEVGHTLGIIERHPIYPRTGFRQRWKLRRKKMGVNLVNFKNWMGELWKSKWTMRKH